MVSCSSDSSQDILSKGEMEDILYDIHLSQNMDISGDSKSQELKQISNREAIYKKYDITSAEWDSSYLYYCRHTDELHEIYENLTERIRNEVVDLGGEVALDESLSGDTANIWTSERNFILMQQAPYNLKTFSIASDSTFKAGDMVTLQFDNKYIFQDGNREIVVVLAADLANDSVATVVRHVSGDMKSSIIFRDNEHIGLKGVRGYFFMGQNINEPVSTTLRLASVENVRMILAHEKEGMENPNDNNKPVNAKDSLSDSIRHASGTKPIGGADPQHAFSSAPPAAHP